MKRDGQRAGQLHEFAGADYVDAAFVVEQAEHHPIRTQTLRLPDLLTHDFKFELGITEIASTRTNHYKKVDGYVFAHLGDQARSRSDSALEKIRAELNTPRATAFCGDGRLD